MNQSFPKKEKLKSQKLIEKLFNEGQSITVFPLRMVYLKIEGLNKVGVSVSKRNFKKAVDRNRIKRLLREAYRLNKNLLIDNNVDGYAFMILYLGKEISDFKTVENKVQSLIITLSNKVQHKNQTK